MIKAEELRIGNYIYDDFNEIHIVEKVESKKYNDWNGSDPSLVVFSKIKDTYHGMYTCDAISGIPLTPEILEKCGFEKTNEDYYFQQSLWRHKSGFTLAVCDVECSLKLPHAKIGVNHRLQYLHELQNLTIILTGQELTINL